MKIMITGGTGQIGTKLFRELSQSNHTISAPEASELDITDILAVATKINAFCPDIIFHCAAYTAVDKAEDEPERCFMVNTDGTRNIAECAAALGSKMVYISTDYVFDGTLDGIYEVNSATNPLSVYGKSKLQGEKIIREAVPHHFIVRTSWVFGNGSNFVKTMLKLGKTRESVTVVSDQIGSPTYAADLAKLLVQMAQTGYYGTYHATNEGFCSWADFAQEIFKVAGYSTTVISITTTEYGAKAKRPLNSRLSKRKLEDNGFTRLPDWRDAVGQYIEKEGGI